MVAQVSAGLENTWKGLLVRLLLEKVLEILNSET